MSNFIVYDDELEIPDFKLKASVLKLSNIEVSAISEASLYPRTHKLIAGRKSQSPDLFYLQSILVSSVWNGNDEYFLPEELWAARNTAEDKPFNYEHDCKDIIGHMTASVVVNEDLNIIDETADVDKLPELIHIVNQSVLYKHWDDEKLQSRMNDILEDIFKNKWFVSVECLLSDFDYALRSKNGEIEIIDRNKKTAFLTKYLRIFGGTGTYDGKQLGRVPRNFIITGKGLVKVPANKDSEILEDSDELKIVSKNTSVETNEKKLVYNLNDNLNIKVNVMDNALELEYKSQIKSLSEQVAQLTASLKEDEINKIKAQVASLTSELESKAQEISVLKSSVEKLHEEKVSLTSINATLVAEKNELATKVEKTEQDIRNEKRLSAAKAVFTDENDAKKFVSQTDKMSDEAFAEFIDFNKKFMSTNAKVVETEVTLDKEKVIKASEIVDEPNLVVVKNDPKEAVKQLIEDTNKYLSVNSYVKTGKPKFKN